MMEMSEKLCIFADMLTQDLISDTSRFRLLLRVSDTGAHAVIFAPDSDGSLINAPLPFSPSADPVKDLQEVIYDNPLLLNEFSSVLIVIEPRVTFPMPSELDFPLRRDIIARQCDISSSELIDDPSGLNSSLFTGVISRDLFTFLRRPFPSATLTTHLGTLTRYFASRPGRGTTPRTLASFRPDAVDVVITSGNRLLLANSFRFTDPDDAVFYLLACRRALGIDEENSEVQLTGHRPHRMTVTARLRQFVPRVMPAIFPPELFKAGKDSLLAPFDLMISSLTL